MADIYVLDDYAHADLLVGCNSIDVTVKGTDDTTLSLLAGLGVVNSSSENGLPPRPPRGNIFPDPEAP